MAPARKLTDEEIRGALEALPGWTLREGRLHREYAFPGFAEAFGFLAAAALAAERMNHHPDWSNSYSRVRVDLVTHDLGAISDRDLALARRMEALAGGFLPRP